MEMIGDEDHHLVERVGPLAKLELAQNTLTGSCLVHGIVKGVHECQFGDLIRF
jgi:hypothetical protein